MWGAELLKGKISLLYQLNTPGIRAITVASLQHVSA